MKTYTKKFKTLLVDLGLKEYYSKKYLNYALIAFSIVIGIYLNQELIYILTFAFLVWQILAPLPKKILALLSLFALMAIPLALLIKAEEYSEKLAIIAFGLLIFYFIMAISQKKDK